MKTDKQLKHNFFPNGRHNYKFCDLCNKNQQPSVVLGTNITNCNRCGEYQGTTKHEWEDPTSGASGMFDLCDICIKKLHESDN
jgi:NMD protein affecting ribosome stability and mRNA decay